MAATTAEIAAVPEARRGPWLLKGFYHSGQAFGAILIIYLIQDYKASPSKSRALYIYDKCIFQGVDVEPEPGQAGPLDLHCLREGIIPSGKVEGTMTLMREARLEAIGQSWFKRITSSGDRKANNMGLGAHVFDEILQAHLVAKGHNNFWVDILRNVGTLSAPVSPGVARSMAKSLVPTMAEIKAAGFDLSKLGLEFMKKSLQA